MSDKKQKNALQMAQGVYGGRGFTSIPAVMEKLTTEKENGASAEYIENVLTTISNTFLYPGDVKLHNSDIAKIYDSFEPFITEYSLSSCCFHKLWNSVKDNVEGAAELKDKITKGAVKHKFSKLNALGLLDNSYVPFTDGIQYKSVGIITNSSFKTIGEKLEQDLQVRSPAQAKLYVTKFFEEVLRVVDENASHLNEVNKNELVDVLHKHAEKSLYYAPHILDKLQTPENKVKLDETELAILLGKYNSGTLIEYAVKTDDPKLQQMAIKDGFARLTKSAKQFRNIKVNEEATSYAKNKAGAMAKEEIAQKNTTAYRFRNMFKGGKENHPSLEELREQYNKMLTEAKSKELDANEGAGYEDTYIRKFFEKLDDAILKDSQFAANNKDAIAEGIDKYLREGHADSGYYTLSREILRSLGADKVDVSKKKEEIRQKLTDKYNNDIKSSMEKLQKMNPANTREANLEPTAQKIVRASDKLKKLSAIAEKSDGR